MSLDVSTVVAIFPPITTLILLVFAIVGARFCRVSRRSITKRTKTCIICRDRVIRREFSKITKGCTHPLYMCHECVRTYIAHELSDKGSVTIRCPGYKCPGVLGAHDVEKFASKEVFARYERLLMISTLSQIPSFRWCLNPRCGSGQITVERGEGEEGDDAPIVICHACGHISCVVHSLPINSCPECSNAPATIAKRDSLKLSWKNVVSNVKSALARLHDETRTAVFMRSKTKACPKCQSKIQKDGGCDHMTCRKPGCSYEFCWECLADYSAVRRHGNRRHGTRCSHYNE